MDQFWVTDEQFATIAPHLPSNTRGKPRVDDRRVISGIIQVLKSGGRWVDAPAAWLCHANWSEGTRSRMTSSVRPRRLQSPKLVLLRP